MNNILNNKDKTEYQRHLRTANLVRELYHLQCKGKRLTPEKLDALCRLTWWNGDKESALINIWNGRKENIPTEIRKSVVNNNVALVNYRNTYRNSTLDWIKTNFTKLSFLVHSVAKMNSDNEAFRIAEIIEELPNIPSPNRKANLKPISLLTPLFACLDPRKKFPIINGNDNVKKLHKNLNLIGKSLSDKVSTLMQFIDSSGIQDAFMLDVMSNEPNKVVVAKLRKKYSKKGKNATTTNSFSYWIEGQRNIEPLHSKLQAKFVKYLSDFGIKCKENENYIDVQYYQNKKLYYCELKPTENIEAKYSIRFAIGQLFEYQFFNNKAANLEIVLSTRPNKNEINFVKSLNFRLTYFDKKTNTFITKR